LLPASAFAKPAQLGGGTGPCPEDSSLVYSFFAFGEPWNNQQPIAPLLQGFNVTNQCAEAGEFFLGTLAGRTVVIGIPPGVSGSPSTAQLKEAGLWLFPTAHFGGGLSYGADPCIFSPNLILNPDGSLSPATC
jgi:hypothetical protein